ncbi:MAG: hypothetical protein Q8J88_04045 [Bacteroidales bacterium]|nr:hypothetical protein [Bacteroidales bacterium]
MKGIRRIIVSLLLFASVTCICAQEPNDSLQAITIVKPFVTLYHQPHDFFGKAFSFQGIEGGVIVQRSLYLGFYGAFFASNLKAEVDKDIQYVWIGQGGVNAAYVINGKNRFHPGCQLNIGIFTLRHDSANFGLFETSNASFRLNGLIVSPQIFGELIVAECFRIRTGLSYYLYSFKDNLNIEPSELNNFSFTFGLVFQSK